MLNYVQRHWRGQLSLAWSFWVNLIGVRVAVFMLQNAVVPTEGNDHQNYRLPVLAAVVLIHVCLLIWQVVGVIRSAERHFSENGNMALVWGVQLSAVLMFLLSAVYALGAVQMTLPAPDNPDILAMMDAEHASRYQLNVSAAGDTLSISGSMEPGITRKVRELLNDHAVLKTVVLESAGGNIYEGRGLAKLFAEGNLATHVSGQCASACTIAFAGGMSRTAASGAKFGFHQYRLDADYIVISTDVDKEQRRDQQAFIDAGVSQDFVQSVFSQPSISMWWPDMEALQAAGFVHDIVRTGD